jgi:EmrB/QacA subfamily drug resistance transporter
MTHKWNTLIAVSIAAFMLLLDITVVNVALPDIQRDLGASFDDLRWVIDAYALTLAATMLISGSLGDRFGRRLVFTGGLAVFSVASLLCAGAWSPLTLNLFRGLQGIGGAAMLATSLALIAGAYSGRDRSVALAAWGAATAGALALGPIIGGALVDGLSWESIFLVNVPIGLITAALVARGVPETRDPSAAGLPDFAGLLALSASMSLLLIALFRGNDEGWGSALIVGLLAASALLLAAFVAIESRVERPLLDLKLFRNPATSGASLAMLFLAASTFAVITYLVFFLQNFLAYDAFETGLRLLPWTVAAFFGGVATGRLAQRLPVRVLIVAGMTLAGVGLLLMRGIEVGSEWTTIVAGATSVGLGIGLLMPTVAAAALGAAPVRQSGMASGLNSTFRILGVAIGVAALGAIMESEVSSSLTASLGNVSPGLVDVVSTGNVAGLGDQVSQASAVAFVDGLNTILLISAIVAFSGAILAALLVRERKVEEERSLDAAAPAVAAG